MLLQAYLGVGQGDVRGATVQRPSEELAGGHMPGHDVDGGFLEAAPPGAGGGGSGGGGFSDGDEDLGAGSTPGATRGETAAQAREIIRGTAASSSERLTNIGGLRCCSLSLQHPSGVKATG